MPLPLVVFAYLQVLDLMSTVAFMTLGVGEANPLIRAFAAAASNPFAGLLLAKLLCVAIAAGCWRYGRHRLLFRANLFFGAIVMWNLGMIILGAAKLAQASAPAPL
jgi:hypothetical protein